MSSLFRSLLLVFALLISGFSLGGCSSTEVADDHPSALMKDAEEDIEGSRYLLAIERLQTIKNKHPYSKEAIEAQLRIADVYYLQDNFAESAASYEAFRDLHPKHAKINYATYRVALSHFNDIPGTHARDLTPALKAEQAFDEYLYRFPKDEFTEEAKLKRIDARKVLAEKETYIADFYYKNEAWDSAKNRYQKVVNKYGDTSFVDHANARLKKLEGKKSSE